MSDNRRVTIRAAVLSLVACSAAATPAPRSLSNTGEPATREPSILVQLAFEPSFVVGPPFSEPPPFTLLDDGTLIEVKGSSMVFERKLSRGEVDRIMSHLVELGVERLQSHKDSCSKPSPNGSRLCVSDDTTTIVRVVLNGKLREIATYSSFSNEPAVLNKIVAYLSTDRRPTGKRYAPSAAAVHVRQHATRPNGCVAIDPELVEHRPGRERWTLQLHGSTLAALMAVLPSNIGRFWRCIGDAAFEIVVVPAVPGFDVSGERPIG